MFGYIGIAMYSFEGNGVVINLRAAARNKDLYPRILVMSMVTIIIFQMSFSLMCYFTYGNTSGDYITVNFVPLNFLSLSMIYLFCLNAMSSYPLQILCCFEILEEAKFFKSGSTCARFVKVTTTRSVIVLLLTYFSTIIPDFIAFLDIVGAIGASTLGFIFPSMFMIK
mmetsp:Transcript_7239/g.5227  ORF Transcript_7239/g.5227 Transcript_7239/m.5227 type:complete len:168 (+) Transcript_7239:734-1237(+)